ALAECRNEKRGGLWRSRTEEPHQHHALLRARCERPRRRCAAEQRDELATSHGGPSSGLAAARYHTVAPERRCASQQKLRADVANGQPRTLQRPPLHDRSSPKAEVHPLVCYVAKVPKAAVSRCSNMSVENRVTRSPRRPFAGMAPVW